VRRDRPVSVDLPKIERSADAVAASAAILDAVSEGDLTPGEAAEISKLIEGAVKTLRKFERHQRYPDELFAVLRGSLNRAPACEMNARLAMLASFSGWWSSRPSAHMAGVMPFPSFVRPQICSCVFVSAIIASRAPGKKAHKTETHPIANAGALHGRDV
jgi:hypothetical protein